MLRIVNVIRDVVGLLFLVVAAAPFTVAAVVMTPASKRRCTRSFIKTLGGGED